MNIALPALVIFLFFLPGLIARKEIKVVENKHLDSSPIGAYFIGSILYAIFLHVFWIFITTQLFNEKIDIKTIFGVLSNEKELQKIAIINIEQNIKKISIYFITLYVFSYFSPKIIRFFVNKYRLDSEDFPRCFNIFKFHDAPWYYLLSGTDLKKEDCPDLIAIDTIIEVAGNAYMYSGILASYHLDSSGDLDRIVLEMASRRDLYIYKSKTNITKPFYIKGNQLILQYKDMKNTNIKYIKFEKQ